MHTLRAWKIVAGFFVGLLVGVALGCWLPTWNVIGWDTTVNVLDLSTFLVGTVLLSVGLVLLEQSGQRRQHRAALLVEKVRGLEGLLVKVEDAVNFPRELLQARLQDLRTAAEQCREAAEVWEMSKTIKTLTIDCESICKRLWIEVDHDPPKLDAVSDLRGKLLRLQGLLS